MRRPHPIRKAVLLPAVLAVPAVAFGVWPTAAAISHEPIRLASLTSPSDTVTFDFERSNCFGGSRHLLRYEPGPTPQVVVRQLPDPWGSSSGLVGRLLSEFQARTVAVVGLSRPQVEGLDRLLQFYRAAPPSYYCTRVDLVKVSRYRSGWRLRSEAYFDGSCRTDLLADAHPQDLRDLGSRILPLVTLDRVISVAETAAQRGSTFTRYIPLTRTDTRAHSELKYSPGTNRTGL